MTFPDVVFAMSLTNIVIALCYVYKYTRKTN